MDVGPIEMTKQEWFDLAWERSAEQVQSIDGAMCSYTPAGGATQGCFIGCARPPEWWVEVTSDGHESPPVRGLVDRGLVGVSDLEGLDVAYFLRRLQDVHDNYTPGSWRTQLRIMAQDEDLQVPE